MIISLITPIYIYIRYALLTIRDVSDDEKLKM